MKTTIDLPDALYLLVLAVRHGARFATLDARINPSLVPAGPAACQVIP